ncbi:pyridoxamine 5'-phosphate oxidase family protein [Spongiimicrobium sp. 3-5]|uniref:pyridoxamine 5'-phosphate oxidase family protein n=1 Tax=Spongiimicrobium sp. 3-5 TaxID=3332596 RepID=UPI00397FEDC6
MSPSIIRFIKEQKLFFVGTAMQEGRINVSPKGMDSFRVINENTVLWLNLIGSGNETAAHLLQNNRMTIMFCAFEGRPMILRLYGYANAYHRRDSFWEEHIDLFPKMEGSRQLIKMEVDLVQTSCGTGVPLMDYKQDREQLRAWARDKSSEELIDYMKNKNAESLDGYPTGILE